MKKKEEAKRGGAKAVRPTAIKTQKPAADPGIGFPIVGIGASAGGLAAFEAFFSGMPADTDPGMAFVLVQHLAPDHKSILTELVKRYTRMQVLEVEDGMVVKPNCAYIIPPNRDMSFRDGALRLLEQSTSRGVRLPIDFFFHSLAEDQHQRAICIVLSGTGSDGTLGIRAIKGEGGMAMAQDPDSTEYDGMPRSAIATGLVDYVLPPARMPAQLIAYAAHAFGKSVGPESLKSSEADDLLRRIFLTLRNQTGHDFSQYKNNTITRRVERRMAVHQIEQLDGYVRYLEETPAEVEALFQDLLIGVTRFFRDPEAFAVLQEKIIPLIVDGKSAGAPIRVWVPACSTGEEAYSIAMLLQEHIDTLKQKFKIQVFATDIDSQAIERARAGVYPGNIAADISQERLTRFFVQSSNGASYRVHKKLRDLLVFSEQDLARDPPFSNLDLISCRNLLIYVQAPLQKKLIRLFHYALNPGGFLFLGASEAAGQSADLFATLDRKAKLYQSHQTVPATRPPTPAKYLPHVLERADAYRTSAKATVDRRLPLRELTEMALLQQYDPVATLVDKTGEILYLHGRTGLYLEPAPGEAGMHIVKMAREGLRRELTSALRHAVASGEAVHRPGLRVKTNGDFSTINLTIRPVSADSDAASEPGLFLVVFEPAQETATEHAPGVAPVDSVGGATSTNADADARISALQQELHAKEEYLQTINEELETSNEELQSSNEELQSVNEELQSTIEELQTSEEELQSVNEELATINAELQAKVGDLVRANNDINNMVAGTGIGTIFVDYQLRILRFTPTITEVINLIPGDVGRAVGHIVTRLVGYDHLAVDTQEVLHTLAPKEIEVQTEAGAWYMLRIHPYRTQENVIEGAVITFFDISEMKRIQEALRESNEEMQDLAERLNVAREEERAAVAWELHDEVSQALAVVRATLSDWGGRLPAGVPENARHGLDETVTLLDATIARLRTLYADIVPVMLEDLDLASAIQWQVEEFGRRAELQCMIGTLDTVALPDARTSLSLFRVLQEALQTTALRTGVTRVTVDFVREGDDAVLRVTDNGRGAINEDLLKPGTPALISIRSRTHSWGGHVRFGRNAEGSSVLEITVPLQAEAPANTVPPAVKGKRTTTGRKKARGE